MTRRNGTLKSLGRDKWLVRLSLGRDSEGKRIRANKIIEGTKRDAERFLTQLAKQKDDGLLTGYSQQTLGQWIDEWLTSWCGHLSSRTQRDYGFQMRRHLTGSLRDKRLHLVTGSDLQRWINELSAQGLAPRTVEMAYAVLRTALRRAVRAGKLPRCVADGLALPKRVRTNRRVLSQEEAGRFLLAAEEGEWGALFKVLLLTGIRPGEALALTWADLNGTSLIIRRAVTKALDGAKVVGPPKSGRTRVVPLGENALVALRSHRKRQDDFKRAVGASYEDNDLIFAAPTGRLLDIRHVVRSHFIPLLRKAGLPALRLYDLRHSHATLLMAAGEHPKVVQERLGHASIQLTLDTYTHVVAGMQERATLRLDSYLAGV